MSVTIMHQLAALAVEEIKKKYGIVDPPPEVIVTEQNTLELNIALSDLTLGMTINGVYEQFEVKLEQFILGEDVQLPNGIVMQWKDE